MNLSLSEEQALVLHGACQAGINACNEEMSSLKNAGYGGKRCSLFPGRRQKVMQELRVLKQLQEELKQ